jgi:hypothetical protein
VLGLLAVAPHYLPIEALTLAKLPTLLALTKFLILVSLWLLSFNISLTPLRLINCFGGSLIVSLSFAVSQLLHLRFYFNLLYNVTLFYEEWKVRALL